MNATHKLSQLNDLIADCKKQMPAFIPDLNSYDVIAVSTSGGKDSQAMMSYLRELIDLHDFKGEVVAIHSDLGRVEWKGTTDLVKEQCEMYDMPLEIVKRDQGDLLDNVLDRGKWPSSSARYCTSGHKRDQIRKRYTARSKEWRKDPQTKGTTLRILECVGLRAEESTARSKKQAFSHNGGKNGASCKDRHVDTWLPIFHWTEEQVWDRIWQDEAPYHEAYDLGMPRLSCVFCIFANESALMVAGKHNPELLDEYVKIEAKIGHSFKAPSKKDQGKPLALQKGSLAYIQEKLKDSENCQNIKVESWTM